MSDSKSTPTTIKLALEGGRTLEHVRAWMGLTEVLELPGDAVLETSYGGDLAVTADLLEDGETGA